MLNPRIALRYAKSLIDLSIEKGSLENVYGDMQYLAGAIKANRDLANLLKSPVVSADKKQSILEAVTKGKISELSSSFINLLIRKGREAGLGEIAQSFIDQYKTHKQIFTVNLTTASPVSEELKQEIVNKLKSESDMKNIELTTSVNEDLIGGFVLQAGDKL
ncbi:MAG: ATP synthase F1 subunit delta, partial [Chitinophagaceae bacterium]|nr:ATP synthase F1 subunit delta [Chitinophagaceae bacterium]